MHNFLSSRLFKKTSLVGVLFVLVLPYQNCAPVLSGSESLKSSVSLVDKTLEWDPTTLDIDGDPVNLSGYKVYYGITPGSYTSEVEAHIVGNNTSYTLSLEKGKMYFFAVTAVNDVGYESDKSIELSYLVP